MDIGRREPRPAYLCKTDIIEQYQVRCLGHFIQIDLISPMRSVPVLHFKKRFSPALYSGCSAMRWVSLICRLGISVFMLYVGRIGRRVLKIMAAL